MTLPRHKWFEASKQASQPSRVLYRLNCGQFLSYDNLKMMAQCQRQPTAAPKHHGQHQQHHGPATPKHHGPQQQGNQHHGPAAPKHHGSQQQGNQHHGLREKCKEVLRCHNKPVDHLSDHDLVPMLKKGVLVDGNTMFWADEKLRLSCEKFARALSITWGSSCEYWAYKMEKHSSGNIIEVAELLNVCWLEVQGTFNTNILAPCTEYEVVFDIKMTPCATGWNCPVKFTLNTPDGCKIESQKCLNQYVGQCYKEISIGKFKTASHPNPCGERTVGFKLQELNGQWKKGLIVRGVIVRPVKCGC